MATGVFEGKEGDPPLGESGKGRRQSGWLKNWDSDHVFFGLLISQFVNETSL